MTNRRLKFVNATGFVLIDGNQAESWFITVAQPSRVQFRNIIAGRLYTLLFMQQGGGDKITWPPGTNAAPVNLAMESITVQTFIGSAAALVNPIAPATYVVRP